MKLRVSGLILACVFGAVTVFGLGFTATRAAAVFIQLNETGTPGYLQLAIDSDSQLFANLNPGESATWLVQASLHDASSSALTIEVQGHGTMIADSNMRVTLIACGGTFQGAFAEASCSNNSQTILSDQSLDQVIQSGQLHTLSALQDGQPREFLVTLAVPASTPVALFENAHASIGLGVHASGESSPPVVIPPGSPPLTPMPTQPLAATGTDFFALGLLTIGLLGLVLAFTLLRVAKARHEPPEADPAGAHTTAQRTGTHRV